MTTLEPSHREQIERELGRPLIPSELVEHDTLDELDDPEREVARQLATRQLVLCTLYLRALVPISVGEAARFIATLAKD